MGLNFELDGIALHKNSPSAALLGSVASEHHGPSMFWFLARALANLQTSQQKRLPIIVG
jgi:hypothetical protein